MKFITAESLHLGDLLSDIEDMNFTEAVISVLPPYGKRRTYLAILRVTEQRAKAFNHAADAQKKLKNGTR